MDASWRRIFHGGWASIRGTVRFAVYLEITIKMHMGEVSAFLPQAVVFKHLIDMSLCRDVSFDRLPKVFDDEGVMCSFYCRTSNRGALPYNPRFPIHHILKRKYMSKDLDFTSDAHLIMYNPRVIANVLVCGGV